MMLPLPWACMARTSCFMLRTTPRTLVSNVAAKLSAVWSVIGPTWPSVAALFTATSRRPNRATVLSTIARMSSSLRTSVLMNSASEPRERSSLTSALPASSRRPAMTTFAPFLAKAMAAARPMPVKAPVINTTGLLIFRFLTVSRFLPAEHGWQRREADKPTGVSRGRFCDGSGRKQWRPRKRLCKLGGMPGRYGGGHGATAPSLFRRGRRRGQPDARGREKAAHRAAFPQPANPRSRIRGRRPVDEPRRARHRIDRRRTGLSRPCAAGAGAGRGGGGSGAQGRTACQKGVRHRLSNRSRDELAAASHAFAARRAEEHPGHDLERLFAGSRRGARTRPARRGLPARRADLRPMLRGGGPGAADRPDAERPSPHQPRSDSPTGIRRRDLHRRFEQGHSAARRDRGLSAPFRARHQTGSWGRQHGDGHVAGCVHPRAGAYARLCEKSAAVV